MIPIPFNVIANCTTDFAGRCSVTLAEDLSRTADRHKVKCKAARGFEGPENDDVPMISPAKSCRYGSAQVRVVGDPWRKYYIVVTVE